MAHAAPGEQRMADDVLLALAATIKSRRTASAGRSYTRQLLEAGPERCARKLGEEAIETVIAGLRSDTGPLEAEAADLLYHLLVLLECRDAEIGRVLALLKSRMGTSGLDEKAARGQS